MHVPCRKLVFGNDGRAMSKGLRWRSSSICEQKQKPCVFPLPPLSLQRPQGLRLACNTAKKSGRFGSIRCKRKKAQ